MNYLSLPVPVALFLRRLFNVVSSFAITNQYLLLQKANLDATLENRVRREAPSTAWRDLDKASLSSILTGRLTDVGQSFPLDELRTRLNYLRAWPVSLGRSYASRRSHTMTFDGRHDDMLSSGEEVLNEKSSSPPPPLPTPSPNSGPSKRAQKAEKSDLKPESVSTIQRLMMNPALLEPVRKPRNPIVLCHGLYGFDVRGPTSFPMLQMHYWNNVLKILKKTIGADVIVTGVPGTGSIESRAERMDQFLKEKARGQDINLVAHSMGGLDCRQLITHVKPKDYNPASLLTVCTPHRGSPFMDWCTENIGIGKLKHEREIKGRKMNAMPDPPPIASGTQFSFSSLPSSFTTLLLSFFDSPAYANLTTHYLQNVFNPSTPNDPRVKYYSVAARTESMSVWHPLWLPKMVLDGVEEKERKQRGDSRERPPSLPPLAPWESEDWGNDGLVSVRSAKWGEFLGTVEGVDHWDIRGSRGLNVDFDWHVDLSLPTVVKNSLSDPLSNVSLNLGGSGEGWSWRDWGKFVGAWRKAEDSEKKEKLNSPEPSSGEETDEVLKSSTDKLSAVFSWITDQVPFTPSSDGKSPESLSFDKARDAERSERKKEHSKDPRLKFDLERFYIALSRKLYDDGL